MTAFFWGLNANQGKLGKCLLNGKL